MKLQVFDSSDFHGKNFFGDDGFRNMFVSQQTLNMLKFKKRQMHGLCYWMEIKGGIYF